MTTAAGSPRGRYQNRGSGVRSRVICVIRFASSRCCSSACGIVHLAEVDPVVLRAAEEQVVGADRARAVALLCRPSAGLPWRV